MIIINNSAVAVCNISGILLSGAVINLDPLEQYEVSDSLLIAGAEAQLVSVFGSGLTIVPGSKLSSGHIVALADGTAVLTAAQLVSGTIFTAVPTANRAHATDTAANIIAAMSSVAIGTTFEFTITNTAAYNITVTAGTNVTLVGSMVCNDSSASFKGIVTSATAVTILRV